MIYTYTGPLCSSSVQPLSLTVSLSSCLFKTRLLMNPLCSDWPALGSLQSHIKLPPMQTQYFLLYCFILTAFKWLNYRRLLLWRFYSKCSFLAVTTTYGDIWCSHCWADQLVIMQGGTLQAETATVMMMFDEELQTISTSSTGKVLILLCPAVWKTLPACQLDSSHSSMWLHPKQYKNAIMLAERNQSEAGLLL